MDNAILDRAADTATSCQIPNKDLNSYALATQNVDFSQQKSIKFIDLFAGLGGTRVGFEQACAEKKRTPECVFTSEIKHHAIKAYRANFPDCNVSGDITQINPDSIPNFDYLLAGFPCQPFSSAGKRNGFLDERGGLFFVICNILKHKNPSGFLLENVDGLASHDSGKTLSTIMLKLTTLGYNVAWKILDASEFGVAQRRKRIYIVGHRSHLPNLSGFPVSLVPSRDLIEHDAPFKFTPFTKLLSTKFSISHLHGKKIKDKRGGESNIHSWDLELKGLVNTEQKKILEMLLKKRRSKKWAEAKGIDWMDGMPLTTEEIRTFYDHPDLQTNLDDLVTKRYVRFEHPKKRIIEQGIAKRVPHVGAPKGYNIVAGKLSFPLACIIDPNDVVPTIVATEVGKIGVATDKGVRRMTVREGLNFSGFPKEYILHETDYEGAFDLIGNTVMPPVIKAVAMRLIG